MCGPFLQRAHLQADERERLLARPLRRVCLAAIVALLELLKWLQIYRSIGAEKCLELLCAQYGPEIVKLKDDRARTPLHVAALHGQCDCAKFLLEQGADVNRQDEDGKTPLISAAFNGQVQIIGKLSWNKSYVF